MKTHILCRCCGDKTPNMTSRYDEDHGLVCPGCFNTMNGHLGLWAMGLVEGVINPKPLPEGLKNWRLPSHLLFP